MTAEELRQMDITPFDCGAMADGMDGCLSGRNGAVHCHAALSEPARIAYRAFV